jgi:hypothetical protein
MQIDTGTGLVVVAALIFYLRLIIIQRQKVKQPAIQPQGKKGSRKKGPPADELRRYSILSRNPRDWIIAGAGFVAVLAGVLLKAGGLPLPAVAAYWWAPTALGIIACSWGFR